MGLDSRACDVFLVEFLKWVCHMCLIHEQVRSNLEMECERRLEEACHLSDSAYGG